jgi:DNA repair protein RecN (Recombination protein N)
VVEERISALFNVARKLKIPVGELPLLHARLRAQLEQLEHAQDLAVLQARSKEQETEYLQLAKKVSAARKKAAGSLSKGISQTIQGLGMQGGLVTVQLASQAHGPTGHDSVEFLVQAHATGASRPLAKVASGGELSRVSLGIAVAAATANPTPTIIFDEADAGVGGAIAEKIGQLMRTLGNERQVLTVTHLAQVAALGHQHYQVSKALSAGAVRSGVNLLNRKERVEEIARMLGGVEITSTTRKHATELLAKEGS